MTDYPIYTAETVAPSDETQRLPTQGKICDGNIKVLAPAVTVEENAAGGNTVAIGGGV